MAIEVTSSFYAKTNLPLDGKSVMANLTARNAISSGERYEGMVVYVISEATNFQLIGGITNGDWAEFSGGGGGAIEVSATQTLAAAATITLQQVQRERVKIKSTGGSVEVLLPNGTLPAQEVFVQGDDSAAPCTIVNGGNVASNGDVTYLKYTNNLYIWDVTETKWVMSGGY